MRWRARQSRHQRQRLARAAVAGRRGARQHGMAFVEWAGLVAIIAAALAAIGVYVSRGNQGRLKQATDSISGSPYLFGKTTETMTTTMKVDRTEQTGSENTAEGSTTVTKMTADQEVTTKANRTVTY